MPLSSESHGDHVHGVFAPGTPDEYVLENSDTPVSDPNAFRLGSRWSTTATNGGGLGQGDPTIVTWSIVPDGTPIPALGGIGGESADPSDLVSFLGGIYGVNTPDTNYTDEIWFAHFESIFDRWSELSGVTYVYEPNDDGAAFTSFSSSAPGVLGVRGDARIGGHLIDGNSGVLAYNFFPNHGEMVIDTADNFYSTTSNNSIRLRNVLAHEVGHGLGFHHLESSTDAFLMEPFINTSFDGPQLDDVLAVHRHYGDAQEDTGGGNDTSGTATSLGPLAHNSTLSVGTNGSTTFVSPSDVDFLSIDDDSDLDYFSFSVSEPTLVDVMLTPIGPTYNEGPQGGSQSPFNASSQSDLTLELIDTNGTSVLNTANATGLGGTESISSVVLPAGTYFVRVTGAQDTVQLYSLDVAGSAANFVAVTESGGSTDLSESGLTDTYDVGLGSVPAGAVEVTATADAQTEVSTDGINFFSSVVLSFTDTTIQTVTVRAIDDTAAEGAHTGTITHAITTTADSTNYPTSMPIDSVVASIADNELAPFERTEPLGGLIFSSENNVASLASAVDMVEFTFFVESGQTISAVVDPGAAEFLTVELVGISGMFTSPSAGGRSRPVADADRLRRQRHSPRHRHGRDGLRPGGLSQCGARSPGRRLGRR